MTQTVCKETDVTTTVQKTNTVTQPTVRVTTVLPVVVKVTTTSVTCVVLLPFVWEMGVRGLTLRQDYVCGAGARNSMWFCPSAWMGAG